MRLVPVLVLLLVPGVLAGQSAAVRRAAATITEADVKSRIFIIAHDSMGGRDTPSPGLEMTAAYIAAEFKRFGLQPGGDSGSFIQRYPIRRTQLDTAKSEVTVEGPDGGVRLRLTRDAALYQGPAKSGSWPVVLVGGPVDSLHPAVGELKGKAAIWYPDLRQGMAGIRMAGRHLSRGGASTVLISVPSDSLMDAQLSPQTRIRQSAGVVSGVPWLLARESAVLIQLPQAGETIQGMRQATSFTALPVEGWTVTLSLEERVLQEQRPPNTVGILEGSDPRLKHEYIVFSAHMDHVGARRSSDMPATADTIWNGADDDASGTVGVVELAEAFSRPGARPKRSLIFLTVSGEEKGLWGSDWFGANPPVPIGQIVANLNADMIGRNWKDTIVVIGREHSDLGQTLAAVNAKHPELKMTAIDDLWPEQSFYTRSDHFNFAKRGVPVLFFFNGTHSDYHRPSDQPEKIDAEKEARIVQLIYWLAREIGNAPERPQWERASYAKYVTDGKQ
ncbi:MAG TPA: M20/M25/M40 family metallo-hydrolase [Gemmatimonadales bacterium]